MASPTAAVRTKRRADDEHPSGDPRFALIDRTLKRFQYQQDALIEVLHTAQEAFGFLSDDLLIYVAHQLKLPLSWVYGVATFYHFFTLKPQGQHNCIVCMGTACYVKRAAEIVAALQKEYGGGAGRDDARWALQPGHGALPGQLRLAPVLVLDGEVLPRETPEGTLEKVKQKLG
jgi:bidirectional [NiFe] hydrogenase diaphorase subunit